MADAQAHKRMLTRVFASIAGVSLLFGCDTLGPTGVRPAPDAHAEAASKLHQCASCHGDDGVSTAEIFPNIAAQQKDYIVAQLTAFRDHTRRDRNAKTYMWGMATGLSDATIAGLAADYAAQSPAVPSAGEKHEIAAGEAIFKNGVEAHGVLACASCHGANGEGNGAIPALAGQHGDYLRVQIRAFAKGARDNAIMLPIAKSLRHAEIKAVTAYLSSR